MGGPAEWKLTPEQAARQSEARTTAILQSALDAIITIDHEGLVVEFNAAAERMFGYSRDAVLGRELAALIVPPALREAHRKGLGHYLATGEGPVLGHRIEVPAMRADGTEFPVELAISPIALDGPPMFTAYLRDITERTRHEAAAEERARLADLAAGVGTALTFQGHSLPDVLRQCCELVVRHLDGAFARVWVLDDRDDVLVLKASAGMYTHTDGPHGRVPVGRFKIGLIARERQPHLTNSVVGDPQVGDQAWAEREGMVAFAGYPLTVDDRVVGVLALFARHRLTDAALQALATVADGIALGINRHRAEETLRESEARVRLLLDSTGEGIYGVDTEGRCTFCNPACARLLGYASADELLGRDLHGLFHHTRRDGAPYPAEECAIYRVSHSGREVHVDDELFWKADGSPLPVEYRAAPIVRDGRTIGAVVSFTDISRRRRSEQEARLRRRALDMITQGICITDQGLPDNPIIYQNPAFARMTGYPAAETIGRNCRFLQGPGTDPAAVEEVRRGVREGVAVQVELLNYRKDGTEFWNALILSPVLDEGGRLTHFVGVQSDVTARRLADRDRARDALRYRTLVEATASIVWSTTADGQLLPSPSGWGEFTGQSAAQLYGRGWLEAIHPEDRGRTVAAWSEALGGRAPYAVEHRVRRADGAYREMSARAVPVVGVDGEIAEWVGVHIDVTDQRRAEAARRETETRFRVMADSMPQLAWMARPDGHIFWYNQRWFDYTGTALDQMQGWGWQAVHDPAELPRVIAGFKAALASGEPWEDVFPLRRHDGAMRWHLSRARPVRDERGAISLWFGTNTDVTEQKRTEGQLIEAKEAAEAASRSKSTFLANMSHELRTPLNAVIGYSEMLQEEAEEAGATSAVADLRKIHAAGRHLLGLINDILDLSKIEAGKMDLFLEPFDVAGLVRGVADTVRPLVERGGNALTVVCGEGLGAIHADLTKTRQVLLNLLSNASKFTQGGSVSLAAGRERAGGDDWLVFRVRDSGIGMSAEQLARLFQPFTQADPSTTRRYGGTGLGLTISRRFCQMMGGDIEVRSEPGVGSTFTVRLPAVVPAPAAEPGQAGRPQVEVPDEVGDAGDVVLVIDDDPTVRELMSRTLEKEGFRVLRAGGGEEGLRLARLFRPAAITLDVMMPGMDGWAVLSALKSDPALADVPVIMVTIVDDKNLGYSLGASEYLTKPVDRKRLAAVLAKFRRGLPGGVALVVDDDEVGRQMVRQMLEREGWSVVEAENGRVALGRVAESPPDLILLDLMMPEMDGFEFARDLRLNPLWREIPVLVLTAKDLTEEDCLRLNGHILGVLKKGAYSREDLLSEIRRELTVLIRKADPTPAPPPAAGPPD